jgi:hypothetical protein
MKVILFIQISARKILVTAHSTAVVHLQLEIVTNGVRSSILTDTEGKECYFDPMSMENDTMNKVKVEDLADLTMLSKRLGTRTQPHLQWQLG